MRRLLTALGLLAACTPQTSPVLSGAAHCSASPVSGTLARPADALADTLGVATFLHYTDTPYGTYASVAAQLEALGVRHVRDSGARQESLPFLRSLEARGVRTLIQLDPSVDVHATAAACDGRGPGCTHALALQAALGSALEGFQLPGTSLLIGTQSAEDALSFARSVAAVAPGVPRVAPFVEDDATAAALSGLEPLTTQGALFAPRWSNTTALEGVAEAEAWSARMSGSQPRLAMAGVLGAGPEQEALQARLLLVRWLESFTRGDTRFYVHELMDPNAMWTGGLSRLDGAPKPAFLALQRLMARVSEPGPAFTPGALEWSHAASPGLRSLVLRQRAGAFLLVLWRDVPEQAGRVAVEIRTPLVRASLSRPLEARAPEELQGSTFDVEVSDVTVLELEPPPCPPG